MGGAGVIVHGDYAMEGAPKRMLNFGLPPKHNDSFLKFNGERPLIPPEELEELKGRRFVIINVWRNISTEPIYDAPLAMVDAQTFTKDDIVTVEFRYTDCTIETQLGGNNESHKWVYYPRMERDEAILLKTFDSQGAMWKDQDYEYYHQNEPAIPASFALHSAFFDPTCPADAPKRESIELRTIVFY